MQRSTKKPDPKNAVNVFKDTITTSIVDDDGVLRAHFHDNFVTMLSSMQLNAAVVFALKISLRRMELIERGDVVTLTVYTRARKVL